VLFHMIPASAFIMDDVLRESWRFPESEKLRVHVPHGITNHRYNADGFLGTVQAGDQVFGYTQVFRSGITEYADDHCSGPVALGTSGKVLVKKKFSQKQLLAFTANMQTSLIGLEACSGAHFLGRALRQQGHDVRLIAAQFVKPFVKSNKNDFVDAEAIAKAVERKNMRFVPIKTDDQLDLQAMHRIRDRLVSRRTAVINQIRAFLLERGMVFAQKPAKLKAAMADVLENEENTLTPMMRNMIGILWDEWKTVEGGRSTN